MPRRAGAKVSHAIKGLPVAFQQKPVPQHFFL
jgi:hypothetical protein